MPQQKQFKEESIHFGWQGYGTLWWDIIAERASYIVGSQGAKDLQCLYSADFLLFIH